MTRPITARRVPSWLVFSVLITLLINGLASVTTWLTIGLMHGVSPLAAAVREYEVTLVRAYNAVAYPGAAGLILVYLWPLIVYFRRGSEAPALLLVQRRAIGAPLFAAAVCLAAWVLPTLLFPLLTLSHFYRWSLDLMSQQILSPLVNGFLAATTSYFILDWLFSRTVVPRVFPAGRLAEVPSAFALSVRARLLLFLLAVAFTPLFTMLGLARAALARVQAGFPMEVVVGALATASGVTFAVYVGLGVALTLLLARLLTRPLSEMAAALRRVQAGDLDAGVRVTSSDEVGALADGVNAMVAALREKERILHTFGRAVDPSVRDRLLAGEVHLGGEVRRAAILFCDLRGFTAFAEGAQADTVVATLNQFFGVMTAWVRECGGFVDKFIGDAMLVVFGLFEEDGQRAGVEGSAAALRCALGIRQRLEAINAARAAAGQPPLAVSGGIHTGPVVAGTIGAEDRHEYTVIGDAVNVAARLQELSKDRGDDFLLSAATYELARCRGFDGPVSPRGTVTLRGRIEPIQVLGIA
jgi:adenylate cyclase